MYQMIVIALMFPQVWTKRSYTWYRSYLPHSAPSLRLVVHPALVQELEALEPEEVVEEQEEVTLEMEACTWGL